MSDVELEPKVEEDHLPGRALAVAAAVTVVVIGLAVTAASVLQRRVTPPPSVPAPALHLATGAQIGTVEQTLIADTRRGLDERDAQDEGLRHFGWVDRTRGIARIPIDQAMDLVTDPAFMRRAFATDARSVESRHDGGP